jgi:hypothetical protein
LRNWLARPILVAIPTLDVVYGQQGGVRDDVIGEALKAEKFVEKIRQTHLQV